jgi:chromosome partitioning protein
MARTIAILNQKGGVGKTTTAINVASYLAKSNKRVLLIDSDPQGNATSGLGVSKHNESTGLYGVLSGVASLDKVIMDTSVHNLSIVTSNESLAALELEIAQVPARELLLANALKGIAYDYVIIDCPPALSLLTINALCAADHLLIPVQAEYYALEGLGQLLDIFQRVKAGLNPRLHLLGVVVTMHDKRNSLAEQVYAELRKHFDDQVFKTLIPRNVRLAEAPSYGKPIGDHDKWSKGARAYKQLTKELQKRVGDI